jgi:cell division protein FtsI (penicillin-binding protein 3)
MDEARLAEKLGARAEPHAAGRHFSWLKRRVAPSVSAAVAALDLPGIRLTRESKRFYPARELAAHVLGFAGLDGTGLDGLERALDDRLAGRPGEVPGLRDALGRFVSVGSIDPPEALEGDSVTLTIDRALQFIVERELALAVERAKATAGSVVVIDPRTGDVLAMANYPTYNPNAPDGADAAARRNRAVVDAYEPGSVFKPFVLAAGLESGVIAPSDVFFAENGSMRIGKHVIHDHSPHGKLTVTECLAKSSNICMAKVARKVGAVPFGALLARIGFGARPAMGLLGEAPGILRPPERWRDIDLATIAFGQGVSCSLVQLAAAYAAIADGGLYRRPRIVKDLRAAVASGAAALGAPPAALPPAFAGEAPVRIFSADTAAALTAMLEEAAGPKGTGHRAVVAGYPTAGKTGTAQKVDLVSGGYLADRFISSFVGFVPADAPRLVIAIAIDDPTGEHLGGMIAAPVFHEIARLALQHLGVPPSGPVTEADLAPVADTKPAGKPAAKTPAAPAVDPVDAELARDADALMAEAEGTAVAAADADADADADPDAPGGDGDSSAPGGADAFPVPDFTGMTVRAAAARAAALGIELEVDGSGVGVTQLPVAGASCGSGRRVRVTFRPPA